MQYSFISNLPLLLATDLPDPDLTYDEDEDSELPPVPLSCPESHPSALAKGRQCCATFAREDDPGCDFGDATDDAGCCPGGDAVLCQGGTGVCQSANTGKLRGLLKIWGLLING